MTWIETFRIPYVKTKVFDALSVGTVSEVSCPKMLGLGESTWNIIILGGFRGSEFS